MTAGLRCGTNTSAVGLADLNNDSGGVMPVIEESKSSGLPPAHDLQLEYLRMECIREAVKLALAKPELDVVEIAEKLCAGKCWHLRQQPVFSDN